jgi:E3 ubiquitin-protein ligase RNF14
MPTHRARLREHMLSEWDEGMPVVFTWIQYLESDEPSALIDRITLCEQDAEAAAAAGAAAASADRDDVERLIDAMSRYDRQVQADEFVQSNHDCEICFDDKPGAEFVRFESSCGHYFCQDCLVAYVELHLSGGSPVNDLCCPSGTGTCSRKESKRQLTAGEVFRIAGKEAQVKFERLLLQQALSSMGDIVFCPKPACQTPTVEESEHFGHCPKCRFAFCTLCFEPFHPGSQCITGEEAIRIARKHNAGGKSNFGPEEQERRKRLIQTAQSLAMIKKSTKQCPSCRSAVSKTRGCNKMSCPCGTKFCYVCSKDITAEGYDHFGPNSCVLFDDAAIRQWEMEMAGFQYNPEFHFGLQVRRAGGGAAAAVAGHRLHHDHQEIVWLHCPRCRQRNVRGENGNNQIRCWACRTKFCACCRGVVMDAARHYGRGKPCRQHGGPVATR